MLINKITTIKLHRFDNELTELEVDTIAAIIRENVILRNVYGWVVILTRLYMMILML